MGGSRTRRTAAVTLLLVTVGAAVAAAVAWRLKPESAAYWGSAIGGIYGLAALYLAWASYRDDRAAETKALALPEVADQLAIAVRAQWAAEVELRRLNDPYALPVRWEPAPADLVEDWAVIERLATGGGAGWPPPPPPGTWASGPADLAGRDGELVNALGRVPSGRLVVLGEPGAGKTILLARLAVDLLAEGRREPGGPVPVLLTLASWDSTRQRLDKFIETRLVVDYPGLAERDPGDSGKTRARRLWEAGLLLLLFDGLDEIPDAVRGAALAKINEAMRPGQRLALTCRTDPYRAAVRPTSGVEVRLTGVAGIEVCPLREDDVAAYLRDSAGGPAAAARWDPVVAKLAQTPRPPVAQALTTPLMVSLARTIYNPRPGEDPVAGDHSPAELLDQVRFPNRTSVEQHLFDGYLPAAYRDADRTSRWKATDAERWLTFLARHLDHTLGRTPNLAWWQLPQAISPRHFQRHHLVSGLVGGLASGLASGLAGGFVGGLATGLVSGLVSGLVGGLASGLAGRRVAEDQTPRRAVRWRPPTMDRLAVGFASGLVVGLAVGLAAALVVGLIGGLVSGLVVGLVVGLAAALIGGLSTTPADLAQGASPISILKRDRAAFRSFVLVGAFVGVLVGALVGGLASGLASGLAGGFVGGLATGLVEVPWGLFVLTRTWLAARGRLPRKLMAFLDDAHRRGVLRQAGAVYQFRHIELQRRLANRPSPGP